MVHFLPQTYILLVGAMLTSSLARIADEIGGAI